MDIEFSLFVRLSLVESSQEPIAEIRVVFRFQHDSTAQSNGCDLVKDCLTTEVGKKWCDIKNTLQKSTEWEIWTARHVHITINEGRVVNIEKSIFWNNSEAMKEDYKCMIGYLNSHSVS